MVTEGWQRVHILVLESGVSDNRYQELRKDIDVYNVSFHLEKENNALYINVKQFRVMRCTVISQVAKKFL